MTIEAGHQGEIFTRESGLNLIAAEHGADEASFANDVAPSNQPAQEVQQQQVPQERPAQNFKEQVRETAKNVQEQQVEQDPTPSQEPQEEAGEDYEPISLGQTFNVPQEQPNQYYQPQPALTQEQVNQMIEARLAKGLEQKQEAAADAGEAKPQNLTREEMQQIINDTLQQRDYQHYVESQKEQVINTYEENLTSKLRNANVDIDNDRILQQWIVSSYKDVITEGRQYLASIGQNRDLTPTEVMKLSNYHTQLVEKELNMRRPSQVKPKGNVTMNGQPTGTQQGQPQPKFENKTVEQIEKEAQALLQKNNGKMRPSDAVKYQRALMKAKGLNKMRFS